MSLSMSDTDNVCFVYPTIQHISSLNPFYLLLILHTCKKTVYQIKEKFTKHFLVIHLFYQPPLHVNATNFFLYADSTSGRLLIN